MLLTILFATQFTNTFALSIQDQLTAAAGNTTILKETRVQGWYSGPSYRGTSHIFWSCLFTIVASVYTAIHPNIPLRRKSPWKRRLIKMKWC